MKRLVAIIALSALVGSIASCTRQKVCATYVKADVKVEKTTANN